MPSTPTAPPLSIGDIAQRIRLIRGQRVILEVAWRLLYGRHSDQLDSNSST
jgi:hypothetical protein